MHNTLDPKIAHDNAALTIQKATDLLIEAVLDNGMTKDNEIMFYMYLSDLIIYINEYWDTDNVENIRITYTHKPTPKILVVYKDSEVRRQELGYFLLKSYIQGNNELSLPSLTKYWSQLHLDDLKGSS